MGGGREGFEGVWRGGEGVMGRIWSGRQRQGGEGEGSRWGQVWKTWGCN